MHTIACHIYHNISYQSIPPHNISHHINLETPAFPFHLYGNLLLHVHSELEDQLTNINFTSTSVILGTITSWERKLRAGK